MDIIKVYALLNMWETWETVTLSSLCVHGNMALSNYFCACVNYVCLCMCACMYAYVCVHVCFGVCVCVCAEESVEEKARRIVPQPKNISKCVSERVSMIHKLTTPKQVCALHSFIRLWDWLPWCWVWQSVEHNMFYHQFQLHRHMAWLIQQLNAYIIHSTPT